MIKSLSGPQNSSSFRNRIVNGDFRVNQRGAAVASTAYAAGAYVMDRWKAGPGGCTLSFASAANGDVTVTITAGTLLQVIEGGFYLGEGGAYVLSWSGTAQARVYQGAPAGAYATSPLAVAILAAGTDAAVEFGLGTVTLAQLEPGAAPTTFERRDDEIRRCQRYFYLAGATTGTWGSGATLFSLGVSFPATMRAAPTVSLFNGAVNGGSALEPFTGQRLVGNILAGGVVTPMGARFDLNTASASGTYRGGVLESGSVAFSAEL